MRTANPPMPESVVSFRGELTRQQFSQVQSLLLPLWARAYVVVPMCVLLFISIGVGWPAVLANPLAVFPDLLFALLVLLASALILWFGRRKAWQANARLHGEIHGQLTAEGLEWNTSITKANFPWSKLLAFKESGDLVLVLYAPRVRSTFRRTSSPPSKHGVPSKSCSPRT
jgi:hypothetical protein